MTHFNKIASVFSAAAFGMLAMTGCEGGDLYSVDAPDWISQVADSIANSKTPGGEEELEGMMEDVYTIGATDYSSGWWAQFSKDYVIPEGQTWNAQFNLNINPAASNTYKNFALIITSDAHRGEGAYREYGAIRFDNQPSGNSEWGDYINRDNVESTLTFGTDTDEGVDKLGGKVTLTIDRSDPNDFVVKMTNGTVTKVYKHGHAIENINDDDADTNIRAFLVVEGSYINFIATNIEPIGGCTSADDKQPLSMELKNMPKKILVGTPVEEAFANLGAVVNFETGVSKEVKVDDLTFSVIPDMETLGTKQLLVIYNKTFKGENCDTPIYTMVTFEVVDKMYTSIGASDNSTPFWGAHTADVKVAPGETRINHFTNYTCGASNWNNFCVVLCAEGGQPEYAVVRADNYGWGDGYAACTATGTQGDWGTWLAAMDGAKVTTYITNNGDGTADIKAVMIGNNGETYTQEYIGINGIDPENLWYNFTVDNCHLEFDYVVGAEDNTTAFWGAHSEDIKVPAGSSYTTSFINNTCAASNWNNFCVVLCAEGGQPEYAVVRADNYGWGDGYAACTPAGDQGDWGTWLAAMDGAQVTVTVTNLGDGTANIKAVMVGTNGTTYTQTYDGINGIDPENLWFNLTVDNCHLVFE